MCFLFNIDMCASWLTFKEMVHLLSWRNSHLLILWFFGFSYYAWINKEDFVSSCLHQCACTSASIAVLIASDKYKNSAPKASCVCNQQCPALYFPVKHHQKWRKIPAGYPKLWEISGRISYQFLHVRVVDPSYSACSYLLKGHIMCLSVRIEWSSGMFSQTLLVSYAKKFWKLSTK